MQRAVWKGELSYGIGTTPISLFVATSEQKIRFHELHGSCGNRLRHMKFCPQCDREVTKEEIIKGYEIEGENIPIQPSELEELENKYLNGELLEIDGFIKADQIDPRQYDKSYWISPSKLKTKNKVHYQGLKQFNLLLEGLRETNLVAIGSICLRNRQRKVAIQEADQALLLYMLFSADELNPKPEIEEEAELSDKDLQLLRVLLQEYKLDHIDYSNEYDSAVESLIRQKVNGEKIAIKEKPKEAEVDESIADVIMQAIERRKSEKVNVA